MRVKFWGTRGSIPMAGPEFAKYGGNTTCLHIESCCLPARHWLIVDGGNGIVRLGQHMLREGVDLAWVFLTHYHHDHTQGFPMWPVLLTEQNPPRIHFYGPVWQGFNPRVLLETIMAEPLFPLNFSLVRERTKCKGIDTPDTKVFVIHPVGGLKMFQVHEIHAAQASPSQQVKMSHGQYSLHDCLLIWVHQTHHPEHTVSYRFEERPTSQVFVFLTDHENTVELPKQLRTHLREADLLVMDSQYTPDEYRQFTAGFGHGTPTYCVETAKTVGAARLGLTHHSPFSDDMKVDAILAMAREHAQLIGYDGEVFACADRLTLEVGSSASAESAA